MIPPVSLGHDLVYIIHRHQHHQRQQQNQPRKVNRALKTLRNLLAADQIGQAAQHQEEDPATVQGGQGQQVHHCQVDRDKGGEIVAEGTPEEVVKVSGSYTGQFLKSVLK